MKKGIGSCLLVLSLLISAPAHAASGWALYDDFSSGIIDPGKWYGNETGNTGRETQRIILSKKLNLSERCYAGTDSDIDGIYSEQKLHFNNPSNIRGIKASVKAVKFETQGCEANTTYTTWVYARLFGRFFNTNPQGADSSRNEVYAYIVVEGNSYFTDSEDTARIISRVRQCKDDNCTYFNTIFSQYLGTLKEGHSATLSVEWDKVNHKFIFTNGSKKVVFAYDPEEYPDTLPSNSNSKMLSVTCGAPNCTATPRPTGFMNALFDNVYIKTSSP